MSDNNRDTSLSASKRKVFQIVAGLKGTLAYSRRSDMHAIEDPRVQVCLGKRMAVWLKKIHQLSLVTPFTHTDGETVSRWSELVSSDLIAKIENVKDEEQLVEVVMESCCDSHQQLLYTFLLHVCELEEQISNIETRYFQHYFEAILAQTALACIPEKAYIVASLSDAKGSCIEGVIEQGQRFTAQDNTGKTLYFCNQRETFVNLSEMNHVSLLSSQVDGIKGLYCKTYVPTNAAAPYFESAIDGRSILSKDNVGELQFQHPQLCLEGGERSIRLTFSHVGLTVDAEALRCIAAFIEIAYLSIDQWVPLSLVAKDFKGPEGYWRLDGTQFLLTLPLGAPACTGCIKVTTNARLLDSLQGQKIWSDAKRWINEFQFDAVDVNVLTADLQQGVVSNTAVQQAILGPCVPFVTPIQKHSGFSLLLPTIKASGLQELVLNIEWSNLPEDGFKKYFKAYREYFKKYSDNLRERKDFKQIKNIGNNDFFIEWQMYVLCGKNRVECIGRGKEFLFVQDPSQSDGESIIQRSQTWTLPVRLEDGSVLNRSDSIVDSGIEIVFSLSDDSDFLHNWHSVIVQSASDGVISDSSGLFTKLQAKQAISIPNPPFVPEIASIAVSYRGACQLQYSGQPEQSGGNLTVGEGAGESARRAAGFYFNMNPLLTSLILPPSGFSPTLKDCSVLAIQFSSLSAGNCLNVYFNIASNAQQNTLKSRWSVYTSSGWQVLKVLEDETHNLQNSGVVNLWIPEGIKTISDSYCIQFSLQDTAINTKINSILVNGMLLTLDEKEHAFRRWRTTLPAGSIVAAETTQCACIETVVQPFPSFSGRSAETPIEINQRIKNQLQYKSRLSTVSSYEEQLIHRFPALLLVKCMGVDFSMGRNQIRVLVLPKLADEINDLNMASKIIVGDACINQSTTPTLLLDGQKIPLPSFLRDEILQECKKILPLGANIYVETPRIALRRYEISLVLDSKVGKNYDYYTGLVQKTLQQKLNPYTQFYCENIGLSPRIPDSLIRSQLEHLPFVQAVDGIQSWVSAGQLECMATAGNGVIGHGMNDVLSVETEAQAFDRLGLLFVYDNESIITWKDELGQDVTGHTQNTSVKGKRTSTELTELSLHDLLPDRPCIVEQIDVLAALKKEEPVVEATPDRMIVGQRLGVVGPLPGALPASGVGTGIIGNDFLVR